MKREMIVERIARAVRGDYEKMLPYFQGELHSDIFDILDAADFWPLVEASEELIKHAHYDPKSERDTFKVEGVWVKGLDTALAKSRG